MAALEFWTRIRDFANGKVREAWMNRYGHERRCPVCDRWTSETGGARRIRQDGDLHEIMTCDGCGGESRWDCRGMLPELATPDAPLPWQEISTEGREAMGALIKAVRKHSPIPPPVVRSRSRRQTVMRDVETLKTLRDRLRAAKGYEPDLAAHLVCATVAPAGSFVTIGPISETHRVCTGKSADGRDIIWEMWLDWCNHPPTVSTDAALCLVEQALPEASIEVTVGAHKEGRRISTAFIRLGDHDLGECWEAATAPLAICAALLSALIAQTEQRGSHGE